MRIYIRPGVHSRGSVCISYLYHRAVLGELVFILPKEDAGCDAIDRGSSEKRIYQCSLCPKTVHSASGLKVHERLHSGSYVYTCPYCGEGFSGHTNLQGHLVHHTGVRQFKCDQCWREFRYAHELKKHKVKDH